MSSSKSFMVSDLTFTSLSHFEFIFVYGVSKCSNLILLHMAVQFSPHHLLKRLSLSYSIFALYILTSFVKNKVPIDEWVYFWVFYLVPLVYIAVFVPVSYCLDDCSFVMSMKIMLYVLILFQNYFVFCSFGVVFGISV